MIIYSALSFLFLIFQIVRQTDNPHKNLKISCETCHQTEDWKVVGFDHNTTTFTLSGTHQTVTCNQCHEIEDFSKAEVKCQSCHEDMHRGQFGVDCERCHQTTTWLNINRKEVHSRTQFPLLGAHFNLDCHSCHSNSLQDKNFRFADVSCFSCHGGDYISAIPNHEANGFSISCEKCHNPTEWKKVNYNHPAIFNIYLGGNHFMKWESCQTCHPDVNNFKTTYCGNCHKFNTYAESRNSRN
jgi:hypothetical protein